MTGDERPRREPAPGTADHGPVLPSRPDADRDEAWGDRPGPAERDAEWYREQRPPHHE